MACFPVDYLLIRFKTPCKTGAEQDMQKFGNR
jgi:hypothetical protein